jgi:hypothetical protein
MTLKNRVKNGKALLRENRISKGHETQLGAIETSKQEIFKAIKHLPKAIADELEERLPKLSDSVSEMVASKIVGESYYRWDSVSSYFPTVPLLFLEVGNVTYARRAQFKARLLFF